jgi:hypothetical protein
VTIVRVAAVLVLVASGVVVFYGLVLDRTGQNIAFTVAGLAVLGGTLAFVSAWFLVTSLRAAREGRGGRAVFGSLFGGLLAIAASMALAGASIFALLTRPI